MVPARRLPLVGVVLFAVVVGGCAPAIESVAPASVAAGETITITGTNLASTATARLEADAGGS
ncbi:MAG TPA: IPT/TIG domain-containing protein, partial [Myxococcota bacterium]